MRPWLSRRFVLVAAGVVLVVVAGLALSAWREDVERRRPLVYLRSIPETVAIFPGAEVTSTRERRVEYEWFIGKQNAYMQTYFRSTASWEDVEAWYTDQLEPRGWWPTPSYVSGDDVRPGWRKAFASWSLSHLPDDAGRTAWRSRLTAVENGYDPAPLALIDERPESAVQAEDATHTEIVRVPRVITESSVDGARVITRYRTMVTPDEVRRRYAARLAELGWYRTVEVPDWVNWPRADDIWASGAIRATLSVNIVEGETRVEFVIGEVPGPEVTPGLPW